jgi:hydrogenase maturation protease
MAEEPDVSGRPVQILVAGVGNAFMGDDGFGGRVVEALNARDLPEGVHVVDFGTGGLDLAYEVMRGYDALVLVDVSRQGEAPGTLYVMEPSEEEVQAGIEDGDALDPHAMDPVSVLRFVRTVGGWPGRVVVIACEPGSVGEAPFTLSREVAGAVDGAAALVLETVEELCTSFR